MKKLGQRKRGNAPFLYYIQREGLNKYLHLVDQGGRPVAVLMVEDYEMQQLLRDFLDA